MRFAAVCGLAGPCAALPALVLAVTCLKATWQFFPGRIDHHNVQMALTMALFAALAAPAGCAPPRSRALFAGAMLAVGFETLPFVAIAAGCYGLRFVAGRDVRARGRLLRPVARGRDARACSCSPRRPSHYGVAACDALSVGMLGTGGGRRRGPLRGHAAGARIARPRAAFGVAAAGAVAVALFAGIEPACLRGPFAQIDPAIRPIWLDHVDEVQPISAVWAQSRLRALMAAVQPLLALALSPLLLRAAPRTCARRPVALVAGVGRGVRDGLHADPLHGLRQPARRAALRRHRRGAGGARAAARRLAAGGRRGGTVLASSSTLASCSAAVRPISAPGELDRLGAAAADRARCFDVRNYRPLADEPPGLVLSFVDGGPFILLGSAHAVLPAPYHRDAHGMIAAAAIWSAPPERALGMLQAVGSTYRAVPAIPGLERLRREAPDGLAVALAGGAAPGLAHAA